MPEASMHMRKKLDARLKLVLLLVVSFITQYQAEWFLPLWLVLLCGLFIHPEMRTLEARRMLRGGLVFSLFWFVMVAAYLVWDMGGDAAAAARLALPMTIRILSLAIAGTAFVRLSSPLESGRAAAWFLRPFIGRRAATAGLALALVAWFLPIALRLVGDISASLKARHVRLGLFRKAFLVSGTALRLMEKKAWELALGISSRKMEDF
jgi:hypothetical protein